MRKYLGVICLIAFLVYAAARLAAADEMSSPSTDFDDHMFRDEIVHLVDHLKLSVLQDGKFRPDDPIKPSDFHSLLQKASVQFPEIFNSPPKYDSRDSKLTRARAVAMIVRSLKLWDSRDAVIDEVEDPKSYFADDNGIRGASLVRDWAETEYVLAIWSGILPDKNDLKPNDPCTRGYAAALVSRSVPTGSYTGLAIDLAERELPITNCIEVVCETETGEEVLFPVEGRTPCYPFLMMPGFISMNKDIEVIKKRRVGARPLIVTAMKMSRSRNGGQKIIVSETDAQQIRSLCQDCLALQTWKVGLYNFARPQKSVLNSVNPVEIK